jgi:hypothetical protein
VEWNKYIIRIQDAKKSGHCLHFKNQAEPVYCDAIIGGDVSFSKVRIHIAPTVQPKYSGITHIQDDILKPLEKCPEMVQKVNQGISMGFWQGWAIYCTVTTRGWLIGLLYIFQGIRGPYGKDA